MKNKLLLFMMAFFAFMHKTSHAQCIMSSSFGSATVSSSLAGASYTASTCNYAAEYATITFSTTGVFSFSTTAAGDYITVTNASNTPIAFGNSPLMAVTIPSVGVYRMHISASGPTLCATNSSCRTSVVFVPLSLCSGAPSAGTVTPSYTICSGANAVISTNGATAASGLIYQWQQSASSSGPWTNVSTGSGYNTPTLTTISLTTTTYYQFVVTCTASALSATTSVVQVNIAGTTTNTIPYAEGFEGITQNNLLPNCSWAASSLGSVCRTYTVATGSYNQIPHTGSKYASFRYGTNASGDYFYSNGVYLTAGQTYSAGAYYITDGLSGWSNFSILYGTAQTPTALTVVSATTGALTNTTYVGVGGSFVAPTSGIYYIAVKCIGSSAPWYLSFDDISVITLPSCSGTPASNTVTATNTLVCSGNTVNLSLATTYTTGGLTYQWASATSSVGPYTAISGATLSSYTTPPLAPSSNWYNCIITCVAGPASTTASPVQVTAVGTITNSVPYAEGFEGITANDLLPNCTWTASALGTVCKTYMAATGSWNQIPHTGSKYASFRYGTNPSGDYFYTSGIYLTAGQTYSASTFYITDGTAGWSNFSILYGTAQTPTALTVVSATTGVLTNTTYVGVGGSFVAPTTGIYYVAIKCIGSSAPWYLSFDDISVITLPSCSGTPASNTVTATNTLVCSGNTVNLSLATTYTTGGLTYQWASATSSVGPYTAISGATLSSYTTPPLAPSSNWYNCVITCTAGPASTTASPVQITAVGTVTNPIPYAEGFESISSNNMLPNCTWTTTSTGTICLTYMSATGSWNQIPHTGSKYASFRYGTNPSGDYFYSNGIALTAGQTYSANVFYITDGSTGWSDFEIMYGAAQTATALTSITATTGVVTNTAYVGLGGTFTPTLSGIYYVAIKCIGAFAPMYLSFDDISVIALPACTGAPASNTIIASSSPACPGSSVTLNLANTYTVAGLTYQWASSTSSVGPFSAISGATQNYYVIPTATATTWYNVVVTCTAASGSVSVSPSQVAVLAAPIYTTTPFLETFDNTWQNRCDNHNVPVAACWSSTPTTGNNSWRRQDDGATALWIGSYGTVTPIGVGSADFNSYEASSGMQGALDLYINLNSSATYTMSFYHINTSGTDSLEVFLSTNGGSTFTKKAGYTISSAWNKKTLLLSGVSSPTCVVRFQATSDWGVTDIGVDSVQFIAPCVTPTISLTASTSSFCIGGSSTLSITGAASSYSWSTGVSATQSIVVSPTVNTVYTATASNGSGCSATQSIAITILPPLTLTVTSSSPSLCAGYSATISASGASNYTWTPGGLTSSVIAISPTSNSSYTVFGASGTCTGQAVSSISVSPSPTITTITSHSICQGNIGATSFSIAALGASTYSWYAPVNSSNFQVTIVNPTVTTVYTVAAVSANGCKSVGTATMLVVNCTGIAQNSTNENAVTLFPNPVNDVFTVVLQNASENMHIQLFDASGKMILNHSLKLGNTTISLKDFAPGVYSYNVISTDSKQIIKNGKLIKQ